MPNPRELGPPATAPLTDDPDRWQAIAAAQVAAYVELSRSYAARGDGRLALMAMWAADVRVLQVLLWESGLGSAPDPGAQLAAVSQAVTASLTDCADAADVPLTPREAVESARRALVGTFDDSVHAMLVGRLAPLDHLDSVSSPRAEDGDTSRVQRLAGRSAEALVADLRATAGDCMAVASAMADGDDLAGAIALARQADLASFEAYLVAAAIRAGDGALATVDLRWDLAQTDGPVVPSSARDLELAAKAFRDQLVGVIGPDEAPGLREFFEPLSHHQ